MERPGAAYAFAQGRHPGLTSAIIRNSAGNVKVFAYTVQDLIELEKLLSAERLGSYGPTGPPLRATLDFYIWNTALSASFYGPLQALEIALRNALHREMSTACGRNDWYSARLFRRAAYDLTGSVAEVANRLTRGGKPVDPPHVVAGLHFGFWTKLIDAGPNGNRVRLLWNAALHRAFPNYPRGAQAHRGPIYGELLRIKDFRNRIAHHEPVHNKRPEREYRRLLAVANWIDGRLPLWIAHHARCATLLDQMPVPRQMF
ncbi:MAG TPA: hypothetical protein VHS78_05245 [Candidatus Elarobacter sp.]|jgi:hypothetical protein|nr:hypothetical protein [Candidatus Elarobacter sp.]